MIVRIYFLMGLFLIFFSGLQSMGYRRLVCLFDPHAVELPINQNFALMAVLLNALSQKSAPIIISPSLWNNFIVRRYRFEKLSMPGPIELDQIIQFVRDLFTMHGKFVMGAAYNKDDINAFTRKLAGLYGNYFDYYNRLSRALNELAVDQSTFFNPSIFDSQRRKLFNTFSFSNFQSPPELDPTLDNLFRRELNIDFLCYMTPFKSSEWIVKQQKDLRGKVIFYVLFPQSYFDALAGKESTMTLINRFIKFGEHGKGFDAQTIFDHYESRGGLIIKKGSVSKRELLTGLKLDALEDASFVINDAHAAIAPVSLENYNFIDLFVTRRDLGIFSFRARESLIAEQEGEREQLLGEWIISVHGHGSIELMTKRRKLIERLNQEPSTAAQAAIAKVENEIKFIQEQGLAGGSVIGLYEKEFFRFIDFLNHMIQTRFLFYDTCYGGGLHARFDWVDALGVLPSGKNMEGIIRSYNYTLASGALTDAVTVITHRSIAVPPLQSEYSLTEGVELVNNRLKLKTNVNNNNQTFFFQGMEKFFDGDPMVSRGKKEETLAHIINYMHAFIAGSGFKFIGNIPLIRFPYTEWFRVSEVEKRIVRLTSVKVRSIYAKALVQNKIPLLNLGDPSVVLLWPLRIPLILTLTNKAPTFISMVGGDVTHIIEELRASAIKATALFGAFFRIEEIEYEKMFIFNKLKINLDIPAITEKGVVNSCMIGFNIENLYPDQKDSLNVIYLVINNSHYLATWKPTDKEIDFGAKKLPLFKKLAMRSVQDTTLVDNLMKRKETAVQRERDLERKSLAEYDLQTIARFVAQREVSKGNLMASYLSLRTNSIALNAWKKRLPVQEQKIVQSFEDSERIVESNLEDKLQRLNFILDILKNNINRINK